MPCPGAPADCLISAACHVAAEKNIFAFVTETTALRSALDALIAAIPDLASRGSPVSLARLSAALSARLQNNATICLHFSLDDVMPAELKSAKTAALGTALCSALMQLPQIMGEYMSLIQVSTCCCSGRKSFPYSCLLVAGSQPQRLCRHRQAGRRREDLAGACDEHSGPDAKPPAAADVTGDTRQPCEVPGIPAEGLEHHVGVSRPLTLPSASLKAHRFFFPFSLQRKPLGDSAARREQFGGFSDGSFHEGNFRHFGRCGESCCRPLDSLEK